MCKVDAARAHLRCFSGSYSTITTPSTKTRSPGGRLISWARGVSIPLRSSRYVGQPAAVRRERGRSSLNSIATSGTATWQCLLRLTGPSRGSVRPASRPKYITPYLGEASPGEAVANGNSLHRLVPDQCVKLVAGDGFPCVALRCHSDCSPGSFARPMLPPKSNDLWVSTQTWFVWPECSPKWGLPCQVMVWV